jgi:uncharacterized membrane protein YedE/YeeE
MKRSVSALLAGALFGVGLVIAGMTQPAKVVGFLDFFGDWDPSLAFVMGGAMMVYFVGFRLVVHRGRPLWDVKLHLPTRRDIDLPLIAGAILFGAGWGLAGYCPGPGLVSLGSWSTTAILFVVSMIVGMALHHLIIVRRVFHGLFQKVRGTA